MVILIAMEVLDLWVLARKELTVPTNQGSVGACLLERPKKKILATDEIGSNRTFKETEYKSGNCPKLGSGLGAVSDRTSGSLLRVET